MQLAGVGVTSPTDSWANRIWQSVLVLIVGAVGARMVWELLEPMLPMLFAIAGLVGVIGLAGRRSSR